LPSDEDTVSRLVDKVNYQKQSLEEVYGRLRHVEERMANVQYYADNAEIFERSVQESQHKDELIRLLKAENEALKKAQSSSFEISQKYQQLVNENASLRERLHSNQSDLEELRSTLKGSHSLIVHLKQKYHDPS